MFFRYVNHFREIQPVATAEGITHVESMLMVSQDLVLCSFSFRVQSYHFSSKVKYHFGVIFYVLGFFCFVFFFLKENSKSIENSRTSHFVLVDAKNIVLYNKFIVLSRHHVWIC